jgi:rhodanese-related sulfurtransferase
MAPYDLPSLAGTIAYALVFGAIGFGFGAVLEMGGFGDTRKLAAQFYLKDMTVLKVMFTAIVVAAVLVAGATGLGLLDMSRVWVNPTYLWPGILGGLVMGVGFVVGGFCPGTSLVAAATLKIDGMVFLLGVFLGVWIFGETVGSFETFFISSDLGRFTLPEWLGLPVGPTVLLVVLLALLMFWSGELAEQVFGQKRPWAEVSLFPGRGKVAAASALVLASVVVMAKGQPTPAQKFELLGAEVRRPLEARGIFVHPAEVVALKKDLNLQVDVLDLRDEHDFNLFHLGGARRVDPAGLLGAGQLKDLLALPAAAVTFLVANGEEKALETWKALKAQGVGNLYVVEGGMNRWLSLYAVPACVAVPAPAVGPDGSAWRFAYATGASLPAAWPERPASRELRSPCQDSVSVAAGREAGHQGGLPEASWPAYPYDKKVKLRSKAAVKGGCG